MRFQSTRGQTQVSLREALEAGLAPDGGLYIPELFPFFPKEEFKDARTLAEVGAKLLRPFFKEDPVLGPELEQICKNTFEFDIPLSKVPNKTNDFILELFHGPTSAFKDVGARFLAECISTLARAETVSKKRTVIVATSGDTGGAVAAAFHGKPGVDVVILFPEGRVSPRQEAQLCAWGDNVQAISVNGSFDDCQKLVKEMLLEKRTNGRTFLSANSINLGRILPQAIYYAHASLSLARMGTWDPAEFVIPTGNLGNALAALWAKKMGLPIGRIHLAFNANRPVVDYLKTGTYQAAPTQATLANAMDVGNPSNLERVFALYPEVANLRKDVDADTVSDKEITEIIRTSKSEWGQILCPHTAVAVAVRKRLLSSQRTPMVIVSTAHPVKFETIVEPLVSETLPIPEGLASILERPVSKQTIDPSLENLKRILHE